MARECVGRDAALQTDCPLECRLRRGAADDDRPREQEPARDQVDWAGLPVNLDLVFSPNQRDKVYVQHLRRKRENQLWRWLPNDTQSCVCASTDQVRMDPDAAESMSSR